MFVITKRHLPDLIYALGQECKISRVFELWQKPSCVAEFTDSLFKFCHVTIKENNNQILLICNCRRS